MHEGKLELIFPRVIHEGGMLVNKRLSKNNGSRGDHGIIISNTMALRDIRD